ncbi:DapH/DapD/GlmU-related protein [Fructilactobacillus fructivorans]|uniref:Sugar O-acetyltransferase n=2 Tax=Fructilactobacillus fructivorans TaxID=1614 RepID=A0AAE6NZ66_9LACO|nr:DapH/DapD/GlmU-related protein [Fructilactobacillus fructivorans]KRK58158.1 hexapeptide repeat-containing acetyltransferase [Fructilactobacillus fructivorans]KRN13008.1 hexapeptide repeat-containing acetyltransferase [Fructilactobacillus fructivorans]KRN41391.1 hexapeptide repeat-containing acetyltransferase [Fructilactobacillus fructivorans]QFX92156.1 sugar O-acetyltransferase [Fructilactobacillus fructivorans]RDV65204.1 sugar O-acetyltransferase [Fructilactobacillus fructivorans]
MDILERLLKGAHVSAADPGFEKVSAIIDKNSLLEQDLNCNRHTHAEQHQLLEKIMQQKIDPTTQVSLPFHTDFGPHIFLGKNCFINKNSMFVDLGGVYFGNHILVGPNVTFTSLNHTLDPTHRWDVNSASVHIEDNVWIGADVTILPGVTVGKNAVIGAGSVVTKDVKANTVVVGSPAHFLKAI